MTSNTKDGGKKVDLTDPNAVEQISDEDLDKVAGGFTRTTLTSSSTSSNQQASIFLTATAGIGDEASKYGGTFDSLKR